MSQLFKYTDYRPALKFLIATYEGPRKGLQTRLAQQIGCQQTYLSRVISGSAELNQEQSFAVTTFFKLDQLEKEYFFLLVNLNRAATVELKDYYKNKIQLIKSKKTEISSRIDSKNSLDEEKKSIYYSDWIYGAIHVLTAIPQFQTAESISTRLSLSFERVKEVLVFLENAGLVIRKHNKYHHNTVNIHLNQDSPYIKSHHAHWRMKSIEALSKKNPMNLNYSSVTAFSAADAPEIKEIMLEAIKKIREVVRNSQEEQIYCYNLDFFEV